MASSVEPATDAARITQLLQRAEDGDAAACDVLLPAIYADLRRIARARLHRDGCRTLGTTELVNEAWLAMAAQTGASFPSRHHYFAYAAKTMRHVLVDRARRRLAGKRQPVLADSPAAACDAVDLLAIDQALHRLAQLSTRLVQVVELRLFVGLSSSEIGALLDVTERTVERDWLKARALLSLDLQEQS